MNPLAWKARHLMALAIAVFIGAFIGAVIGYQWGGGSGWDVGDWLSYWGDLFSPPMATPWLLGGALLAGCSFYAVRISFGEPAELLSGNPPITLLPQLNPWLWRALIILAGIAVGVTIGVHQGYVHGFWWYAQFPEDISHLLAWIAKGAAGAGALIVGAQIVRAKKKECPRFSPPAC